MDAPLQPIPQARPRPPARERHEHFVTCARGLEPLLHAELKALKFGNIERQVGGVQFTGTALDAARANLELRTAIRVLRRVATFAAADEASFHAGAKSVPWEQWIRIDATTSDSRLDHTHYLEQLAKDAICDRFRESSGARPSVDLDDPVLPVRVHLSKDRCKLLLDTSGDSLHKRGWRVHQGKAPLAETFAAALVLHSGWDLRSPLVDPFCGSGTILVEALLKALDWSPGLFRKRFAHERWKDHDAAAMARLRAELEARRKPASSVQGRLQVVGRDASATALDEARANLRAAGLVDLVRLEQGRAEDWRPKRGWNAWLVSNPPWGERIGDERAARAMLEALGHALRQDGTGWTACVLSGNPELERAMGLGGAPFATWHNGGIECRAVVHRF
jgi:putative N6-adenine-specific DNA methylase